jgi:4-alpha-glucanotransferase
MRLPRASGILLHPTSLPGRFGIGDLGHEAYRFVDFLAGAGQTLWQVMPLGPTGYGDSPYQSFSSFAGNPLLISPELLVEDDLLLQYDIDTAPFFAEGRVDFGAVIPFKQGLLRRAYERFQAQATPIRRAAFRAFCRRNAAWLDDYALFAALKEAHNGAVWSAWEKGIAAREPDALRDWRRKLADAIEAQKFVQYLFFTQWGALKEYANAYDIRIIGDLPIFVAYDSADVWAHPEMFFLDDEGQPTLVAGVPPDFFSETGQLWGNPLYRWDVLAKDGYAWWIERVRAAFKLVDIIRLDHFRGFEGYWEVPFGELTAVKGRWVKGPGADLFNAILAALGPVPIIAEDLGVITPEVVALRDQFDFPSMKVFQFAFTTDASHEFLPHNYRRNCVVYTGTHDNDTALGWFQSAPANERDFALQYTNGDGKEFNWDLMRWALASVADTAIVPLQDVLGLGNEARMNLPGRLGGNWSWRYVTGSLAPELQDRLGGLAEMYGRRYGTNVML